MSNKCRNCDATAPDWSGNGLCIVCARDEMSKDQERAEQELDTIFRKDWILERYQNEIPEWSDGSLQLRIVYYDGNTETYPYTASYDLVKADLLAWHQRKLDEAVTQAYLEFCNKYLGYRAASDTEAEAIQWLDMQRDELEAKLSQQEIL